MRPKKSLKDLGLGYEKILACRNNCMLFWKDIEHLDFCTKCGLSKWKDDIGDGQSRPSKRRPIKVLRWFPLILRLQRLFMSQHTCNIPIFFFYLINKFECYAKIISHSEKITNFQYKTIPLKYFSLYKIPTTMPNMAFKQIYPTV
jgi:hypothetical protein